MPAAKANVRYTIDGLVFLLSGLGKLAITETHAQVRRGAFALIVVGTLLVAVPLTLTGYRAVTGILDDNAAHSVYRDLETIISEQAVQHCGPWTHCLCRARWFSPACERTSPLTRRNSTSFWPLRAGFGSPN